MHRFRTLLTVIGAVAVLVLAGNTVAYAATGGKFFLGKTNKASKQSVLKRTTSGPALKLTTKSPNNAPLTTNGRGKVGNLNADLLDGLDSSSLMTGTYSFTKSVSPDAPSVEFQIPLPEGSYVVGYSGTLVGGGSDAANARAYCFLTRTVASAETYYASETILTVSTVQPALSGSAVVTLPAGSTLTLTCGATSDFHTVADEPIRIYATRTAVLGGGAL